MLCNQWNYANSTLVVVVAVTLSFLLLYRLLLLLLLLDYELDPFKVEVLLLVLKALDIAKVSGRELSSVL